MDNPQRGFGSTLLVRGHPLIQHCQIALSRSADRLVGRQSGESQDLNSPSHSRSSKCWHPPLYLAAAIRGIRASWSVKRHRSNSGTFGQFGFGSNWPIGSASLRYSIWPSTASCVAVILCNCVCAMSLTAIESPRARSSCNKKRSGRFSSKSRSRRANRCSPGFDTRH